MKPLHKPLLIYDGDCAFCRRWVHRWRKVTGSAVDYEPASGDGDLSAVRLVDTDGKTYDAAEAVYRSLAYNPRHRRFLMFYRKLPGFAALSEALYRLVAGNRAAFSCLDRFLLGENFLGPSTYEFTRWLFLRLLALIYFAAFVSAGMQAKGLFGSDGILPARSLLVMAANAYGPKALWAMPTVFWLNASDAMLVGVCQAGAALACLGLLGIAPAIVFALLWALYLSIFTAGGLFLGYQWDVLLLETGFLAIFLAPLALRPGSSFKSPPSGIILWLMRFLLFRLMFLSGVCKLAGGDPAWRKLEALLYHYQTQPLPTVPGWLLHHLPVFFHKFSAALMFGAELVVPFLIFAPRRPRIAAAWVMIAFQTAITITGNYCFFNLLTIALCLLLIDDDFWKPLLSWPPLARLEDVVKREPGRRRWPAFLAAPLAAFLVILSVMSGTARYGMRVAWPERLVTAYRVTQPFGIVNTYGLFAVMTKRRLEIEVTGSNDEKEWEAYRFKYKPDDLKQAPRFTFGHQPRLDWQMWFAALATSRENPWFMNFCVRLLQGSPEVLSLLESNPFPDAPPKYVMGVLYEYRFSSIAEWRKTGEWWQRRKISDYSPVLSLKEMGNEL